MANTNKITLQIYCPFCERVIRNDSDIVLEHIMFCAETKRTNPHNKREVTIIATFTISRELC